MAMTSNSLDRLVDALKRTGTKIVLAESCTGGAAAASLATCPGISEHLCGSMVTYRLATKRAWLGISAELIRTHTCESAEIVAEMARSALEKTPEADISAAIVGHLGPGAPPEKDGKIWIACQRRGTAEPSVAMQQLSSLERIDRQREAAERLYHALHAIVDAP